MVDDVEGKITRKPESNWRRVPAISRDAIRFVRDAAPGHLRRVWGLQAFGGVPSAVSVGVTAILLFDGGRIIEHGSHDELMAIADGRYAEMYTLQADALLRRETPE